MNIYQLLPNLALGDGVGNEVMEIDRLLKEKKINTKIFADGIDPKISGDVAAAVCDMPELSKEDIVLYHFSIGTNLNQFVKTLHAKIIFRYHNITPSHFFTNINPFLEELCKRGEKEVRDLKDVPVYCLAVSEFNKKDLISYGYTCPIEVIPIILRMSDYEKNPEERILKKYNDDATNLLFVGRIAPNKKQDDIIKVFKAYCSNYNKNSRLFIVGGFWEEDSYYKSLLELIDKEKIENVIITGHISFEEELAYYKLADVFVCMSEHEGFCIPLIEAMYFNIPIVAYNSTAVPYTLGDAGVLVDTKESTIVSAMIDKILKEKNIYKELTRKKLNDYTCGDYGIKLINKLMLGEWNEKKN